MSTPRRLPIALEVAYLAGRVRKGLWSWLVLTEQPTEQVSSMHAASAILAHEGQPGEWTWRLQIECPVWTVPVAVLEVDPEDLLK